MTSKIPYVLAILGGIALGYLLSGDWRYVATVVVIAVGAIVWMWKTGN